MQHRMRIDLLASCRFTTSTVDEILNTEAGMLAATGVLFAPDSKLQNRALQKMLVLIPTCSGNEVR